MISLEFSVPEDGRVAQPFGFRPHRSIRAAFPHTLFPKVTRSKYVTQHMDE